MKPVKGEEPGAFVLTSKQDGKKYVMSEATLDKVWDQLEEEKFYNLFDCEWAVATEEERRLAEEIRQKYF